MSLSQSLAPVALKCLRRQKDEHNTRTHTFGMHTHARTRRAAGRPARAHTTRTPQGPPTHVHRYTPGQQPRHQHRHAQKQELHGVERRVCARTHAVANARKGAQFASQANAHKHFFTYGPWLRTSRWQRQTKRTSNENVQYCDVRTRECTAREVWWCVCVDSICVCGGGGGGVLRVRNLRAPARHACK